MLVLAAVSIRADAATLFDPALKFRTLPTEHFLIYFHQGEELLAARLAAIAEDVWPRVGRALGIMAPRRTHVVLADQSELANGWATPLPYNMIFVTAAAPAGSDFIGRTEDWLRLVFTHEFTHIVHLDRSEGWARVFRGIFGRTAIAFPNLWLPAWHVEGLAAWEESALTGDGRLHAGDFRAVEREAARAGRLEPLDRINGGLTDWPDGFAPYAFGLAFHEYLATQYGESRFAALAARTARTIPFFGPTVFDNVYGKSLGDLWKDYQQSLTSNQSSNPSNLSNPVTRLTRHGHIALGPRFAAGACPECPHDIIYSVRNPDGFPALRAIGVDGSKPRHLTTRYLGSTVGVNAQTIVFDQQEFRRNVGLYSDLYLFDRQTGSVRALTRDQRLQDPDLSPDGESIVCVRQNGGQRDLVLVRLSPSPRRGFDATRKPDTTYDADAPDNTTAVMSGFPPTPKASARLAEDGSRTVAEVEVLVSELDTQFNAPRWSPDGRSVAVEQHRLGAESEIVIVDLETRTRRVLASDPVARIVTPAWRPDGRALVAAADFDGDTFNLYEFSLTNESAPRQLTDTSGGATWPDVSADGRLIAFVGYTADGFDVFTTTYPEPATSMPKARIVPARGTVAGQRPALTTPPSRAYSPWSTLVPTSWTPIVETADQLRAGVATNAFDVLGRHGYSASATWLVDGPDNALVPSAVVPDWRVGYAYDRWRPTFFVSASSNTLFSAGRPDSSGRPSPATLRERELEAGVVLPFRRVRATHRAQVSFVGTADRYTSAAATVATSRIAARMGVATDTSRMYGYSVSREDGVTIGATAELARRALGFSVDGTVLTADGRAYLPGLAPHHVWALRAAGGTSSGPAEFRRTFVLGGAASNDAVLHFGRDAMSLLRGFHPHAFAGTRVALLNLDYRVPLGRPQRGLRTWPIFLHTVHVAAFADVGHAWTDRLRRRDVKTSAGGELSLNLVGGYVIPFTTAFGAAWGHDGADQSDRATFYVRIGRAF